MQDNHVLSIVATTSGLVGGVSRALVEKLSVGSISFHGVIDVAFYAVISASVGYCVKVTLDEAYQKIKSKKSKK
jgi:hypothetical protein